MRHDVVGNQQQPAHHRNIQKRFKNRRQQALSPRHQPDNVVHDQKNAHPARNDKSQRVAQSLAPPQSRRQSRISQRRHRQGQLSRRSVARQNNNVPAPPRRHQKHQRDGCEIGLDSLDAASRGNQQNGGHQTASQTGAIIIRFAQKTDAKHQQF